MRLYSFVMKFDIIEWGREGRDYLPVSCGWQEFLVTGDKNPAGLL